MNSFKETVHQLVKKLGADEFFVALRQRVNFLRRFVPVSLRHKFSSVGKFVPTSSSYPKDDSYIVMRDNTTFKINRSDYVQWRIFYGVRDNALQYAKKCLTPDSVVLDIGANCGGFSLKLATYAVQSQYSNLQIHAFEPNERVVKTYRENLALNPAIKDVVQVHPVGMGSQSGDRTFQYPDSNTGVGRVSDLPANGQMTIKIQRLDDFVDQLKPAKISFIKMIVEGFEPEVFKGGWNTIRKFRPPIFFEVTPEWYQENNGSLAEVLEELRSLGYQFKGEYYNEMIPYQESKFSKLFQYNLLADIQFK